MKNKCLVKVLFMLIIDIITYNKKGEFVKIHPFYYVYRFAFLQPAAIASASLLKLTRYSESAIVS